MGIQERKEREKRARQEAILKAAQDVFLSKGLDQTTIDDIAEKAEISKGTIYLYFKSKEELYISVFLKGIDILANQFQEVRTYFQDSSADELIQKAKDIYYAFFMEYPEYFYIMTILHHGRNKEKINPYIWALTYQKPKKCLLVIADIIKKGIADGLFREVDCWKAANSFWGTTTGVMMLLGEEDRRKFVNIPIKELLDYSTNLMLEGLRIKKQDEKHT